MVRVLTVAGEVLADLPTEDVDSVRSLKLLLAKLQGISRFRQRILQSGSILADDALLNLSVDVQLVVLPVSSMSPEQAVKLTQSAELGYDVEVENLLQTPVDPNDSHRDGYGPLLAAASGHSEVVNLLLEANADVAAHNEDGETALVLASDKGSPEITKSLLEAGAGMNVEERHWAIYRPSELDDVPNFSEIVKLLVRRDLDDALGQRGLVSASTEGQCEGCALAIEGWVQSGSHRQRRAHCPHVGCIKESGHR